MNTPYKKRIQHVFAALKRSKVPSCMVVSSAPVALKTRDQYYPYRQDSDFYYLTGINEEAISLVIATAKPKPLLIAPVVDKVKSLWDGAPTNYKALAQEIGAELIITKDVTAELRASVRGHDVLYHQNRTGTYSDKLARDLQALQPYARGSFPSVFAHLDTVLEEMRLIKDSHEVKIIKEACAITTHAILGTASMIRPGIQERVIAKTVDYWFGMLEATPGFSTIAATGRSAATLHYSKLTQTLKKGELFLLDCGAEYRMYNGDISRTFPVGGKFSPEQRDLYDIVLSAQRAALRKVRHGVLIKHVYDAAAKVMIQGLIDLKVLKGNKEKLLAKGAHKLYFPHGIGHSLGIDVHDVGKHRGNNQAILQEGMVFTIEPGLYFAKKTGKISPCGIRIEDDVLVKRNGYEVLTESMPKDPDAIEVITSE